MQLQMQSQMQSRSSEGSSPVRGSAMKRGGALAGATVAFMMASLVSISSAEAQGTSAASTGGFSVRPLVGALLPTGDLSDQLKAGVQAGAQVGWQFSRLFGVTGSFAWSPSKDKTTALSTSAFRTGREEAVDLFQYDLGLEGRLPVARTGRIAVTPYAALGVGGRTYSYRDVDSVDAQTNLLGYGALGVDLAPKGSRYALRLEARDNVTAFKGLRGEYPEAKARNDVQLSAGLAIHF